MEQFADRIRKARRLAGLSQTQAAQALNVHRGTFGHWERGAGHLPTSSNLVLLALVLGVSYEWLATGRGSIEATPEDGTPAVRLDCFARTDEEEQLLQVFRKLPRCRGASVVKFANSLVCEPAQQARKLAAPTSDLHPAFALLQQRIRGTGR